MRFVVTKELGKLARWLRILGFDTIYFNKANYASLIILALQEDRIIITRAKKEIEKFPKNSILITKENYLEQIKELKEKLNLKIEKDKMFTRCTVCNQLLEDIKKEEVKNLVPEYVYTHQEFFMRCSSCNRIYWQGSHWGNVKKTLENISLS